MIAQAVDAIALRLRFPKSQVRTLIAELETDGVYVTFVPTTGDLCPKCATHYATEETGFCVLCNAEAELERQREADEQEQARLASEVVRLTNAVKKARERMRKKFRANPRDQHARALWEAANELLDLIENDDDETGEEDE